MLRRTKKLVNFRNCRKPNKKHFLYFASNRHSMIVNYPELLKFIKTARNFAGRDENSSLSLEDIYNIADNLRLNGIIYLEKLDEQRHVCVLFDINQDILFLYDPLSGGKKKSYNEIHLGMYCKPVGSFRDGFNKNERLLNTDEHGDVWAKYEEKGKLLYDFLKQHDGFKSIYADNVSSVTDLPVLQKNPSSPDCALIALFIISLFNLRYAKP